jgi:hypothetical protein
MEFKVLKSKEIIITLAIDFAEAVGSSQWRWRFRRRSSG